MQSAISRKYCYRNNMKKPGAVGHEIHFSRISYIACIELHNVLCEVTKLLTFLKNVLQEMIVASSKFSTREVCIPFSHITAIICSIEHRFLYFSWIK